MPKPQLFPPDLISTYLTEAVWASNEAVDSSKNGQNVVRERLKEECTTR